MMITTHLLILIHIRRWDQEIDVDRVQQLMETVDSIRGKQFKFN